jgi:2-C-methyl-D-erythritol 4-phosphate cytidylyltransferase
MNAALPKQYLSLKGRTVIEHTLERLSTHPRIGGVVVALAPNDPHWQGLSTLWDGRVVTVLGGAERCHSVLNALEYLMEWGVRDDWVVVHDAARPCVRHTDLDRLFKALESHSVGALLGVPVRDTMKRCDANGNLQCTVDRRTLWHALTPQMFRLKVLRDALRTATTKNLTVTDEASAMELMGLSPRLIEGHADNIKITRPEDLALAEFYLKQQELDSII